MEKPVIFDKKPKVMELEAGTYWWCACGRSKDQPFCDGSHQGTGIQPLEWKLLEKKRVAFCLCKQTKHAPLCDGTHSQL